MVWPWSKRQQNENEPEATQPSVEQHPDTHLLQYQPLTDGQGLQLLELQGQYYLLYRHARQQISHIYPLTETAWLNELKAGPLPTGRLENWYQQLNPEPFQLQDYLPEHLRTNTRSAASSSPTGRVDILIADETEGEVSPPVKSSRLGKEPVYPPIPVIRQQPLAASLPPLETQADKASPPETPSANSPKRQAEPSEPAANSGWAQPSSGATQTVMPQLVSELMNTLQRRQAEARTFQAQLDQQNKVWQGQQQQLPALQQRLQQLEQALQSQSWQDNEGALANLHQDLQVLLKDSLVLQAALEAYGHQDPQYPEFRYQLEQTLQRVTLARQQTQSRLQQQQQFRLEALRKQALIQRKSLLQATLADLHQALTQLDLLNRELLSLDPYAVPEPVPVALLHEISRLEFEQQVLQADPAFRVQ